MAHSSWPARRRSLSQRTIGRRAGVKRQRLVEPRTRYKGEYWTCHVLSLPTRQRPSPPTGLRHRDSASQQDGTRRPLVASSKWLGLAHRLRWSRGAQMQRRCLCRKAAFGNISKTWPIEENPGGTLAKPAKYGPWEASPLSRGRCGSVMRQRWMVAASPSCWFANENVVFGAFGGRWQGAHAKRHRARIGSGRRSSAGLSGL